MAKFWRLIRALILASAITLGGVQPLGSTQPSRFAMLFTNPDGTPCRHPCLFGVRPGETLYENAIKLLQMHPFTSHFEADLDRGVFSGPEMSVILFKDDQNEVSRIDLIHTPGTVLNSWASLGEVVAVLGTPDVVGVEANSIRSYYLTGAMTFFHSGDTQGYVRPDEGFDCLFVFAHPLTTPSDRYLAAWHGFSSIKRYRDRLIVQSSS